MPLVYLALFVFENLPLDLLSKKQSSFEFGFWWSAVPYDVETAFVEVMNLSFMFPALK
jgi:hypothetical protein